MEDMAAGEDPEFVAWFEQDFLADLWKKQRIIRNLEWEILNMKKSDQYNLLLKTPIL